MSNLPGLIVDVEARIDKLEKGLKRANAVQNRTSTQMERRARQSAETMRASYGKAGDSILATFRKLGPGLIAGLSVAAIGSVTANLGRVVNSVAQIGDEAKRAGVSVQALQEWSFVGKQNRIGIDQVVDGLKELNLRADEWVVTAGGPAAEAFTRLGFTATDLKTKLKDPSELLLEIIGRMEGLDDAARIRISDEIFGGSAGERFAELVGQGEAALRRTITAAHETGAVLDNEMIEKAAELDRRFSALQSRMSGFFKMFAVELADTAIKIATLRGNLDDLFRSRQQAESLLGSGVVTALDAETGAADANAVTISRLRGAYETLADAGDRLAPTLTNASLQLRSMGENDAAAVLADIATEMRELSGKMQDGTVDAETFERRMGELALAASSALAQLSSIDKVEFSGAIAALGGFMVKIGQAIALARELRASLPGSSPDGTTSTPIYGGRGGDPREMGGSFEDYAASTVSQLAPLTSPRPSLPSVDASFGAPASSPSTGGGTGSASGSPRKSEYEQALASIAEETAALRLEAQALAEATGAQIDHGDALEYARTKADLLTAAQKSGMALTPELRAKIDAMTRAYVDAAGAADLAAGKIAELQASSKRGAQSVTDIFTGMATGALTAKQAVGQLLIELLKLSLQKRLMAAFSGSGGSVLGKVLGVLGGGFADGGYTGAGGKHEPAGVVHKGEYVLSKAATQAIGVSNLDTLHSGALRGYASGGYVGPALITTAPVARTGGPSIAINAPMTINATGGTPDQNEDLARRLGREMENSMRKTVVDELMRQMRPGNLLNRRTS